MRASPASIRICVPNLVAVRRTCLKKGGGGYRQTDRQRETAALYSRLLVVLAVLIYLLWFKKEPTKVMCLSVCGVKLWNSLSNKYCNNVIIFTQKILRNTLFQFTSTCNCTSIFCNYSLFSYVLQLCNNIAMNIHYDC